VPEARRHQTVVTNSLRKTQFSQQLPLVDVVDKRATAVDFDHRQPLAVPRLELVAAGDVDLVELERHPLARAEELRPRTLAEMAAVRVVQRDASYG
jgi:hypothetical protein